MNIGVLIRSTSTSQGWRLSTRLILPQPRLIARNVTQLTNLGHKDGVNVGSHTDNKLKSIVFPPFLKSLFLREFNKSILSYAEVLNYDRYIVLQEQIRQINYFYEDNKETINKIEERGTVPEHLLKKMEHLELNGMFVPKNYGGADLMNTEALRLFQEMGKSFSLAELFRINETMCTKMLVEFGTTEQKEKYLPKICTGELWTATCVAEESAGSDPNCIKTKAEFNSDTNTYHIKGTKTWVSNALKANVFLVFSQVECKNYLGDLDVNLTAFIVDRDTPGLHISKPYSLTALNGLEVCDVTFDCNLATNTLLGEEGEGMKVYQKINHENKYFMAGIVCGRLKELLNQTISHAHSRWQYGAKLSSFPLIKLQIAKASSHLYALESMLYITSGLADIGTEPDTEIESACVKEFAVNTSDFVTRTCLNILGAQTNLEGSEYSKFLAENQVIQAWQGSSNINKCFIAISGIMHVIEHKGELLGKANRGRLNPYHSARVNSKFTREIWKIFPKRFKLGGYVHPRLANIAKELDEAANMVNIIAEMMLVTEGLNIQIHERNLEILSDITIEVYAQVCAISRASRAYIVGHAHAQCEIDLVIPFILESKLRIDDKIRSFLNLTNYKGDADLYYEASGSHILEYGEYIPVNPLTKNSF